MSYWLRIDRLESRLNAMADEFAVGRVILCSPEYPKAHMVEIQGEASNFGGFVCVYNILTRIHHCIKVEETMEEVMKQKKDLARLNIKEDESITVYPFSVVVLSLFE